MHSLDNDQSSARKQAYIMWTDDPYSFYVLFNMLVYRRRYTALENVHKTPNAGETIRYWQNNTSEYLETVSNLRHELDVLLHKLVIFEDRQLSLSLSLSPDTIDDGYADLVRCKARS